MTGRTWDSEIFTVRARRCLRCGGLLVSDLAVRRGYGSHCWQIHKEDLRMERETPQFNLFDMESLGAGVEPLGAVHPPDVGACPSRTTSRTMCPPR